MNAPSMNIAKDVQPMKMKEGTKMFKKLMESIRRNLLKIDWFKREVDAYLLEQKIWARILRGGSVKL